VIRPADFLLVGAGAYGAGLAWELTRRGARVLVLEAGDVASGASGGVGQRGVRSNGRDARELPLMKIAQEKWRSLARMFDDPRIFQAIGHLQLVEAEADMPAVERQLRLQEAHGVRTRLVVGEELRQLEPHLRERVIAALYSPDDGASDHGATTRAFASAARQGGAIIQADQRVVGLEITGGRVTAVTTSGGDAVPVAGDLVLAANAGTVELLASVGVTLPFANVLPQVLVTSPVAPVPVRHVIGHVSRRLAAKALPRGEVMVTGGWLGRVDPYTGRPETIADQVEGNLAEAVAVFPDLAGVQLTHALADRFESVAPDLLPVIDRVPGVSNALVAAGWSGHGWGPAPAYVALIADWLLERRRPELLEPFGLARFR
jgi:sarcosine oxidase, subunit beta